jgi:hypothetical protein
MHQVAFASEILALGKGLDGVYEKWREGYLEQLRAVIAHVLQVYVKDAELDGRVLRFGQNYVIPHDWDEPGRKYKDEATIVNPDVVNFLEAYWEDDLRQRDLDFILTGTAFTVQRHDTLHGFHVRYTGG